jgi:hypothetical protein
MYHDGEATIVSFQGKPEAHKKIASLIKKYLDIKIRQVQTPPKKYTGPKDPFKPARESSRAVFYKNCDPTGNVSPYRSSTGFR